METRENKIQSFEFCKFTGKFHHHFSCCLNFTAGHWLWILKFTSDSYSILLHITETLFAIFFPQSKEKGSTQAASLHEELTNCKVNIYLFYLCDIGWLYNNQINVHALIGQSAVVYCTSKLMEKSCVFWTII